MALLGARDDYESEGQCKGRIIRIWERGISGVCTWDRFWVFGLWRGFAFSGSLVNKGNLGAWMGVFDLLALYCFIVTHGWVYLF
jgi:hypothetical protein